MSRPVVLHVIPQLIEGGAARALVNAINAAPPSSAFAHQVVSLLPPSPHAQGLAVKAGLEVLTAREPALRQELVANADIVQIHFWNHPALYEFMREDLPPARILVVAHVSGGSPPQIITSDLLKFADFFLTSNPYSLTLPVFKNLPATVLRAKTDMVLDSADLTRLENFRLKLHTGFNVGYLGTVEFVKMHPRFVTLSAQARIPNVKFIVGGIGGEFATLQKQAEELGAADHFDLRGYVRDITPFFEILDVFGYPLCSDNYASAELVLQEAMFAGVPPVVLPYGAPPFLVRDNETGLVVQNEADYGRALEFLYRQPEERERLGRNAANLRASTFRSRQVSDGDERRL